MLIALLEDDKALNISITKTLQKEGFYVDSYLDGLELFNSNKTYDLYILDINTPNISGLELLKYYDKVIIISAHITAENINIAYQNGAIDFIKKPFFKEELLFKIDKLFPKQYKIKQYNFDIKNNTLKSPSKIIQLSSIESSFLCLFINTNFVSNQDIFNAIGKKDNSLYIFIYRLKKKTSLEFKNIKKEGYKLI